MSDILTRQYSITRDGVRCTVELRIDMSAVAIDMVNNAARNPSGKATLMHGNIVAKVIDRAAAQGPADHGAKAAAERGGA